MIVKTFEFNPIAENTYVAYDDTKECVIIDPGCFFPNEKTKLLKFITENNLIVKHLINTHLHFDHTFGLNFIKEQFGLKTMAHKDDEYLLAQMSSQMQMFGFPASDEPTAEIGEYLNEGHIITFGNQRMTVLHVPGHSLGSVVFYNQQAGCLFGGDVLFRGSIGRTDLPGGSLQLLLKGIKEKLLKLPKDTIVYPGHGSATTIGEEIRSNYYLQ